MGALSAGFLLLQLGTSQNSTGSVTTQLAVAVAPRAADNTASRGSGRTDEQSLASLAAQQIALASQSQDFGASADEPQPTTTTTEPPTTTTTAPPATTTTKPKPPTPKPPVETQPSGDVGDDVWARLAKCESGMRNDQGAPYYGYFQFTAGTWRGIGGDGLPTDHTYDEQLDLAKKLQERQAGANGPFVVTSHYAAS